MYGNNLLREKRETEEDTIVTCRGKSSLTAVGRGTRMDAVNGLRMF